MVFAAGLSLRYVAVASLALVPLAGVALIVMRAATA